jgi:predicted RND superfamily exporter protein
MNRIDQIALRLADFVIARRWFVVLGAIILTAAAGTGGRLLEFSNNYRVFFSSNNPELVAFENLQATYTKNDNIIFVVQPEDRNIFQPRVIEAVERITEKAWKIPYAIRVDSITNFQHSWADGDDLTVEDLIRGSHDLSIKALDSRKEIALAEPLLRNNLIADDGATTGINVVLQYPEESISEIPEAVEVARSIAEEIRAEYPDLIIVLSGVSMLNNAFAEAGQTDSMTLIPLMYGVLLIIMIIALRSWAGTAATLAVIGFSTIVAMGLAGLAGIKLSPISILAPTVILTLSIADSIHILVTVRKQMQAGRDKLAALRESVRVNFTPIAVTSLTTVVGFLGLNFTDTPPFWHLGNITATGIVAAWLFSITLLPALISILPMRVKVSDTGRLGERSGVAARLAGFVTRRHRSILLVTGAAGLALTLFAPRVELNDEFVKYFDYRISFRGDAEFGMENLNGIYAIEFSLEADGPGGVNAPAYLERLNAFTLWLRSQPEVTHVTSYADIIKRLNRNMHGDEDSWYRLPDDRELAAQYLLLYELSLPYGLDLNDRINIDKSATRVTASLPEISTAQIRAFILRAKMWLAANTPEGMRAEPTGSTVMFSFISQRNIESMLVGNVVAIGLIAAIMILVLRSWKLGVLSLIPNLLPIAVTFGIWAVTVGQVGMAAATVTTTALGIVVDDTVHFLSKYLRARREQNLDPERAVVYAFESVGQAILVTTVILIAGFGVLAVSTFLINSQMGVMTALAIGIALVLDFTLLPALLVFGGNLNKQKETKDELINLAPADVNLA